MPNYEYIKKAPLRRLMRDNGASIVASAAVETLAKWLQESAALITKTSLKLTKHSKRKKITREDILLALKYF